MFYWLIVNRYKNKSEKVDYKLTFENEYGS